MFSYRLLHSPRKKPFVSFLILFNINPFFMFHSVAFPFENVCSALIFAFHSVWFRSLCPVLPHNYLLFSLSHTLLRSVYLSTNCCKLADATLSYQTPFACLPEIARPLCFCLPACLPA